jgi:hypothetical protein
LCLLLLESRIKSLIPTRSPSPFLSCFISCLPSHSRIAIPPHSKPQPQPLSQSLPLCCMFLGWHQQKHAFILSWCMCLWPHLGLLGLLQQNITDWVS